MQVRCPHCHNPIEIVDDSSFKEIPCPTCGSCFSLISDSTDGFESVGHNLAHFELIEQLGVGAFGAVWKAKDTELDRIVAIKIPRKEQLSERENEQFLREARAAAQLKHPNIVTVHEVGREGDVVYIVSDYIDGLTLSDWLTGQQPSVRTAVELCVKVADALHAAHESGVVHRDLKPSNIILDREIEPHVTDFGLAKRDAGEITMTVTGQLLGTPAYMSPEQARGEAHKADARADVYALGVILFELLTGELPFRGNQSMLLHQVLTEDAPNPRKLNNSVPPDVATLTLKCLEKAPEARPESAGLLQEEFERFLGGHPIHSRPISPLRIAWRWSRRQPALAGLAVTAAALVLTLLTAAYVVSRQSLNHFAEIRDTQISALLSSTPDAFPHLISSFRPSQRLLIKELETVFKDPPNSAAKLRAAMVLAEFGSPSDKTIGYLVRELGNVDRSERANIFSSLKRSGSIGRSQLERAILLADRSQNWVWKARLAICELHLGSATSAAGMLETDGRRDTTQRSVFIHTFHTWHGNVRDLSPMFDTASTTALRSGLALCVGGVADTSEVTGQVEMKISEWYFQSHAGVHSAADWALERLQEQRFRATVVPTNRPLGGAQWYINSLGMHMLLIPERQLRENERRVAPFFLSNLEVSVRQFRQFMRDPDYPIEQKPNWANDPARDAEMMRPAQPVRIATGGLLETDWTGIPKITGSHLDECFLDRPMLRLQWTEAALFCNWLSWKDGLQQCYDLSGREPVFISTANGYRLPSEMEWEHACRAGTETLYSFGDDSSLLGAFAVFQSLSAERCGTRMCNRWGLFDMHGNAPEWCGRNRNQIRRGGSWKDIAPECSSSSRHPQAEDAGGGFRIAQGMHK